MKNVLLTAAATAIMAVGAGFATQAQAHMRSMTVKGRLVDMKCFSAIGKKAESAKHAQSCGKMCLSSGIPAGIVHDGKAWTLATNPMPLAKYYGDKIKVTGKVDKKDMTVIPSKIWVKTHGHWKTVGTKHMHM